MSVLLLGASGYLGSAFAEEIIAKNEEYRELGGKFIIPGLRIRII